MAMYIFYNKIKQIQIKTVKVAFFLSGVEVLQVIGVEVSIGGSTESNVTSFEAFVTIYLSITRNISVAVVKK
jgi:hypothetical protein